MAVFLLSVTHRTAPVAIRERLAMDGERRTALTARLAEIGGEAVAIATCNRTELYWTAPPDAGHDAGLALLAEHAGLSPGALAPHLICHRGPEAVRHLFRVAAGLDSLILGEPQILGQVRDAAEAARAAGTIGPVLSRLFDLAIVTGKRARSETPISQGAGSVSQAAVELARELLGDLAGRRALVIGAGETGRLVATILASHRLDAVLIANRTRERADEVAREVGGRAIPWEALDDALVEADVAIAATSAPDPVLTRERVAAAMEARVGRPLVLVDIAVPRDIEPSVADLPGVRLRDIDALEDLRADSLRARQEAVPLVEAIVDEEVQAFAAWEHARAVAPVIRELRERVETIREQEVRKALRRLGHLDERDRQVILALSHGITNKLLHTPLTRLRQSRSQELHARTVAELFGLDLD